MNNNLARFDVPEQNLELIINQDTGEVFASQSAIARMVNIPETSVRRWLKSVRHLSTPIISKIPTSNGFARATLHTEKIILEAFIKFRPEMVSKFNYAGMRLYLHHLAGFKIHSSACVNRKLIIQDKEWNNKRHKGKKARVKFTDTLTDHGVRGTKAFANLTNQVTQIVTGKTASKIKKEENVAISRNKMTPFELKIMNSVETIAEGLIDEHKVYGYL